MKKFISSLLVILVAFDVAAQTLYSDAVKLKSYILFDSTLIPDAPPLTTSHLRGYRFKNDTASYKQIFSILSFHTDSANGKPYLLSSNIFNTFSNNPFVKKYLPGPPASSEGILSTLSKGIRNLDVTAFADGLAQFLVERTKEELNEAFFRKFAAFLDYYPEFKTLFPNTTVFVNSFNSWEYANLLNTLREAFDKDIKEILANIIKLKDLQTTACDNIKKDDFKIDCISRINALKTFLSTNEGLILLSSIEVGNGLLADWKIPDILDSIAQPTLLLGYHGSGTDDASNVSNSIKLISIISGSLRSNLTGKNYISEDEFKQLLTDPDPVLQDLYLGLLYQKILNANIQFKNSAGTIINVANFITPNNRDNLKAYITSFSEQAKNLQTTFENLKKDKTDAKADLSADYGAIFQATQQLLQSIVNVSVISADIQLSPKIMDVLNLTSKSLQIAHDIAVRNYNAVVIGTLKLFSDEINQIPNGDDSKSELKIFASAFLKYGSFAANVVLSKDPDEIKDAIKAFALPAGSSSVKKHTSFNISLNAYTGFVYGKSLKSTFTTKASTGVDSSVKLNGGNLIGIYAPVGIGFNFGSVKKKNPASVSVFLSLIDIGAVVGYRFTTDSGQISQKFKISLENIFAPGGNLIFGLPNMPLSIGGGLQWIPTLQRDPKSNEFYNIDHSGWRWQIFAAVDLPVLNLHTSKKNLLTVNQ